MPCGEALTVSLALRFRAVPLAALLLSNSHQPLSPASPPPSLSVSFAFANNYAFGLVSLNTLKP